MTDQPSTCPRTDELAPEVALGLLAGQDRAEALTHVAQCRPCRKKVDELAETADRLLPLAPTGEPPAGFEAAVLRELGALRPAGVPQVRARRNALIVGAAAAFCLVLGVVVGRATATPPAEARAVAMVTPEGRQVGDLWVYNGPPTWLLVSVPGWRHWEAEGGGERDYALQIELVDGDELEAAEVELTFNGTWSTSTTVDPGQIRSVSIVDDTGRVWCSGRVT